jgi:hypothetical protein
MWKTVFFECADDGGVDGADSRLYSVFKTGPSLGLSAAGARGGMSLHHRFRQPRGGFQFRSLPFGLTSGPSAFQQVVRLITELPGCVNILDDLLIWGRDMAEHDARLRNVLDRLAKYGATLRVEKCVLGQPEVDFNGHRVSANGVRPLQSNVAALKRIPPPTNQRQLSRFVGAATY